MSTLVSLKFQTDENTSPLQLSQFLQLFVTTYRALEKFSRDRAVEPREYKNPTGGLFSCLDYESIKYCLESDSFETDPKITFINQQSPIEIVIVGTLGLLTIAAVLSGGKQKITMGPVKLEFNLISLGESIAKLKLGLTSNSSLRTGYEFTGATIKLSKEEFSFLNKKANMNGGFQRFINELQVRVNKGNREIELSNRDIERILRYKSNPKKGGFQSRFKKIFGRHFN